MDFLVFKIHGDYAHFKKYYTTTSPLTFDFPPRTVVTGILGAIAGLGKSKNDETYYLNYFKKSDARIGIKINSKIERTILAINYLKTAERKGFRGMAQRKQIRVEVVKNPDYTIFFSHNDSSLYNTIRQNLEKKHSVYTPYFGSSEFIAALDFITEVKNIKPESASNFILVNSILDCRFINNKNIQFEDNREYMKANVPNEMVEDRIVTEYIEVLYERQGCGISCIPPEYYKVQKDNIVLL